jgi:hypothetical protein
VFSKERFQVLAIYVPVLPVIDAVEGQLKIKRLGAAGLLLQILHSPVELNLLFKKARQRTLNFIV